MADKLAEGRFYGRTLKTWSAAGLLFSETAYPAGAAVPRHAHRSAYLCHIRSGRFVETLGSRSRECGPRAVAFHPPEEWHAERILEPVRSFNIEATPAALASRPLAAEAFARPNLLHGGLADALALRLYQEFREPDAVSPLAAEGLLLELLALALRAEMPSRSPPRWLNRIDELLRARFAAKLTLTELAAEADVHPVHLATVFRRTHGHSVGDAQRRLRIEAAERMLAAPDRPLADIALAVGFADQSHFTRVFKRLRGMTPHAFRQMAKA